MTLVPAATRKESADADVRQATALASMDACRQFDGEVARVRTSGALGRSPLLIWLFDYLVDRFADARTPKESEMIAALRGQPFFDDAQEAAVRVYAHRLRRKLDEFYAAAPVGGGSVRLRLLRGEYRLVCEGTEALAPAVHEALDGDVAEYGQGTGPLPLLGRYRLLLLAVGVTLALMMLGSWAVPAMWPARPYRAAPWNGLGVGGRTVYLAIGDYYIFGEAADATHDERLVRHFDINSAEDLDTYLMEHPERLGHYMNLNLHYLPEGAGSAIAAIVPQIIGATGRAPKIVAASRLTADMMRDGDVVYVGYLSGMALLRDEVFRRSRFTVGTTFDEIVDQRTGHRFHADWGVTEEGRTPHTDYGYLAALNGRSGGRLVIIAGTRDAALMQVADLAGSPATQGDIAHRTGGSSDFEALFRVNSIGNTDLSGTLLAAQPSGQGLHRP